MKITLIVFVFSLLFFLRGDVTIDENLKVRQPKICFEGQCPESLICRDQLLGDTISVFLGNKGFGGYIFRLDITENEKKIKLIKWTDYPAYDGKSSIEVPVKKYKLKLNKRIFKKGDTIRATFNLITEKSKYSKKTKIVGDIYHIIGGNLFVWNGRDGIRDDYYNNGFQNNSK